MGTKIIFCSSEKSEVAHELEAYNNTNNELYIQISNVDGDTVYANQFTVIDKETAIKFVKHLKRQIANIIEIEREEANNV